MALRKLLSRRFFDSVKTTMSFERTVVSSPPLQQAMAPPNTPLDDGGFLRRFFLLRHAVYHSGTARLPEFLSLPVGEKLRETLKGINNAVGVGECRVGLGPVPAQIPSNDAVFGNGMSVKDARKILRASQMEKVKAKLKNIPESSVPYSEFLRICVEACENSDQGAEFAKILDESGNVIVLGNVVFLRPEQVTKSIESLIYQSIASPNDPRRKELKLMEKKKWMIDKKARAQVQAELYFGLSFLTVQTIGFMRLTFWELSWDVMEPICFFVTTFGFGLSYFFFLKTSTEPTFQGFFHQRFRTKQERLMKTNNFDICRYNELFKACYPNGYDGGVKFEPSLSHSFHHSRKTHDLISDLRA